MWWIISQPIALYILNLPPEMNPTFKIISANLTYNKNFYFDIWIDKMLFVD